MSNPNPKYLKPHAGLTDTQRKSLGLERVPPRIRQPGEAPSITYCNASIKQAYRYGDGDIHQPIRPGADRKIASRGF